MATSYFSAFNKIVVSKVQLINLFQQIALDENLDQYSKLFQKYMVQEDDTIESIAKDFYGSKKHYWVVALSNKMKDVFFDFPLKDIELKKMVELEYTRMVVSNPLVTKQQIFDDLVTKNDAKKLIQLLKPIYLQKFFSLIS